MMEKEEKIFNRLNNIISKEDLSHEFEEEIDIPMPDKIRKIIDQAKLNLAERSDKVSNISDFLDNDDSIPLAKCALDGTEEEEERNDDPLKDFIDENE